MGGCPSLSGPTPFAQHSYVLGFITTYSGAIVDIPEGWILCDGQHNTPDMRNRFIAGAGSSYAVGAEGGSNTHTHNFTTNGHNHYFPDAADVKGGAALEEYVAPNTDTGTTDATSNLPEYYALAYIMEIR